jgi:hypothetical protein
MKRNGMFAVTVGFATLFGANPPRHRGSRVVEAMFPPQRISGKKFQKIVARKPP